MLSDFNALDWTVFAILAIAIHIVGYHVHRRYTIQRLLVIREELDQIKLRQVTGGDVDAKRRETELMQRAERLLGSIGIDPYEHLRDGRNPDSESSPLV
ncbi:MAG: hypothetical protein KDA42_19275 [Planctomycetales bacterium]|nr:hypothetical protein [Planctomycetales bacterium]